jgi:hypothetical protein
MKRYCCWLVTRSPPLQCSSWLVQYGTVRYGAAAFEAVDMQGALNSSGSSAVRRYGLHHSAATAECNLKDCLLTMNWSSLATRSVVGCLQL